MPETLQDLIKDLGGDMIRHGLTSPLMLDGLFLEWTQRIYAEPRNLLAQVSPWLGNNSKGGVFIELRSTWSTLNQNRSPAIIVEVGDQAFDHVRYGSIGNTRTNPKDGTSAITDYVQIKITWSHFAQTYSEARLYSSNTVMLLRGFAKAMAEEFGFENIHAVSVTAPVKDKDVPTSFRADVVAAASFNDTVTLQRETPLLKRVGVTLTGSQIQPQKI